MNGKKSSLWNKAKAGFSEATEAYQEDYIAEQNGGKKPMSVAAIVAEMAAQSALKIAFT